MSEKVGNYTVSSLPLGLCPRHQNPKIIFITKKLNDNYVREYQLSFQSVIESKSALEYTGCPTRFFPVHISKTI